MAPFLHSGVPRARVSPKWNENIRAERNFPCIRAGPLRVKNAARSGLAAEKAAISDLR